MSASHRFLKITRLFHLYLGVFTAPALLFFAITGGLQTFSLHERARGSDYTPPAWLATMAQLHKKQTSVIPPRKPALGDVASGTGRRPDTDTTDRSGADVTISAAAPAADRPMTMPAAKAKNTLPLKIFFALVSLGLLISTLSGLYMAYKYTRHAARITAILLAGVVVPIVLALL